MNEEITISSLIKKYEDKIKEYQNLCGNMGIKQFDNTQYYVYQDFIKKYQEILQDLKALKEKIIPMVEKAEDITNRLELIGKEE